MSSHLPTADKNPVWPKKLKNYFPPHFTTEETEAVLTKNSKIYFPSSRQSIWTGMGLLAEKRAKKISPPTDKSCEKATRVRLIHFNILLAIQERQS